ncbi:MAG TPA: hypothetical protein DDX92_10130 [Flavobacteriales bacterium]|jgi:hypothetical protein|nr:hypothetical protein [Flavobacteriales bacterium]
MFGISINLLSSFHHFSFSVIQTHHFEIMMSRFIFLISSTLSFLQAFSQFGPREIIDSNIIATTYTLCADMNNDNLNDIVVSQKANSNARVSVYYNLGQGNFGSRTPILTPSFLNQTFCFDVGDLNNDGWNDIVLTGNQADSVVGYAINNNGSFSNLQILDTFLSPAQCKIVDIDKDGDNDIVATGDAQDLFTYYNDGNLSFTKVEHPSIPYATEFYDFALADINQDGFEDVIIGGVGLQVFMNNSGTLQLDTFRTDSLNKIVPIGLKFVVLLKDLDGDGLNDLIECNHSNFSLTAYKNNGNGFFSFLSIIDSSAVQLQFNGVFLADIDGDSFEDLLAVQPNSANRVICYFNDGSGSFPTSEIIHQGDYAAGDACTTVHAANLDQDSLVDLVWTYKLSVHKNVMLSNDFIEEQNTTLSVYPNPTNDRIQLLSDKAIKQVQILDLSGKEVFREKVGSNSYSFNSSRLAHGTYIITALVEDNLISRRLVVY